MDQSLDLYFKKKQGKKLINCFKICFTEIATPYCLIFDQLICILDANFFFLKKE